MFIVNVMGKGKIHFSKLYRLRTKGLRIWMCLFDYHSANDIFIIQHVANHTKLCVVLNFSCMNVKVFPRKRNFHQFLFPLQQFSQQECNLWHILITKALFSNLGDYVKIINKTSAFDTRIKNIGTKKKCLSRKSFSRFSLDFQIQIKLHITDENRFERNFLLLFEMLCAVCQMIMSIGRC